MFFVVMLCSLCLAASDSAAEMVKLKGSGASFPFPLYGRWFKEYGKESAWKRAAGVYVRILSQPQLYIEGNHRTGCPDYELHPGAGWQSALCAHRG
jgi:ABC-type phosphate transport system substrate-binding protein